MKIELPREIVGKILYFVRKIEAVEKIQKAWKISQMRRNIIYEKILRQTNYFHWDDNQEKIINIFKIAKRIKCKSISNDIGLSCQMIGLYNYINNNQYNEKYVIQIKEIIEYLFPDVINLPDF